MIEVEREEEDYYRYIRFEDSKGCYIKCFQERVNKQGEINKIEDSESAAVEMIRLKGVEAQLMEESGENILLWTIGQNVFALHGNLSPELLISVAEQIILKN